MAVGFQLFFLALVTWGLWMALRPECLVKDKRELGVWGASPVYSDEKGAKLLTAPKLQLQGKPDYIFETWFFKRVIPLEIKSGQLKDEEPHSGDVYQLAAYFLIIEELYGKRPPYGKLVYANKTFKIRNTYKLRRQMRHIIKQMRAMLDGDTSQKAEPSFAKCKHCVCKMTVCEFYKGEYSNEKR